MLNREAVEMPNSMFTDRTATLSKKCLAVRLVQHNGRVKLGSITHLNPGSVVLCGPGYNEHTAKVRRDNEFYLVFTDDLN